ncbi:4-oxalocrotonate tautomerase family protein [Streptomyces sp. NBC_01604]|uniref:tautomerase family protein n=1 Tax=Streptomyces sp. NBC_01604 TaxID=2975894 RepID=UPI00386E2A93
MPLVRIDLIRGRHIDEVRAVADATHRALVDVLDIPERTGSRSSPSTTPITSSP